MIPPLARSASSRRRLDGAALGGKLRRSGGFCNPRGLPRVADVSTEFTACWTTLAATLQAPTTPAPLQCRQTVNGITVTPAAVYRSARAAGRSRSWLACRAG